MVLEETQVIVCGKLAEEDGCVLEAAQHSRAFGVSLTETEHLKAIAQIL